MFETFSLLVHWTFVSFVSSCYKINGSAIYWIIISLMIPVAVGVEVHSKFSEWFFDFFPIKVAACLKPPSRANYHVLVVY